MIITLDYYEKFNCISSNCKHNCCIGWEIEIDNDTFEKLLVRINNPQSTPIKTEETPKVLKLTTPRNQGNK